MVVDLSGCKFEELNTLLKIIKTERNFQIQVFSLETIESFEIFLRLNKIIYKKMFTSNFRVFNGVNLLIKDTENFIYDENNKIILFSNESDFRLIPFSFKFTKEEKKSLIKDKHLLAQTKDSSISTILAVDAINYSKYIAEGLDYLESIIIMNLIHRAKFSKLWKDVRSTDNSFTSRTVIYMKLRILLESKILLKEGDFYCVNISRETLQEICKKIGFDKALQ